LRKVRGKRPGRICPGEAALAAERKIEQSGSDRRQEADASPAWAISERAADGKAISRYMNSALGRVTKGQSETTDVAGTTPEIIRNQFFSLNSSALM